MGTGFSLGFNSFSALSSSQATKETLNNTAVRVNIMMLKKPLKILFVIMIVFYCYYFFCFILKYPIDLISRLKENRFLIMPIDS